ncbi:MAG: SMR family transporter [Clostridia bacterium]
MIYVILSVLASAAMAAIFKFTEGRNLNRNFITTINYATAVVVSLFSINQAKIHIELYPSNFLTFFEELKSVLAGGQFSIQTVSVFAIVLGGFTGILYFVGIIAMQISVRNYGAGLAGMFSRAGMIIPILLSIILWKEFPSPFQWIGIVLALAGVVLANMQPDQAAKRFTIRLTLLLQFITSGLSGLMSKTFQTYGIIDYRNVFLLAVFSSAFIISLIYTYKTPKSWGQSELFAGFLVGIFNQLSATFLLLALNSLPAPIVYPLISAGAIVVINIMGMAFFNERLKRHELIAVGLTVIAVLILS